MHISSTLPAFYGRHSAAVPKLTTAALTETARLRLAAEMDREADRLLVEGRVALAERLSHLAADLRASGRRG